MYIELKRNADQLSQYIYIYTTFVYPLRLIRICILSSLITLAIISDGIADTSVKCSASPLIRCLHSVPSSRLSA